MKFTNISSIAFILSTVMGIMSTASAADKTGATDVSPIPRRHLGFRGNRQQGGRGAAHGGRDQGGQGPPYGTYSGDFGSGRDQDDGERDGRFHPESEEDKAAFCMNFNCTRAEENFPAGDDLPNCTKPEGPPEIDLEELKEEDPEKYNHLGCLCCDDENEEDDEVEDTQALITRGQPGMRGSRPGPPRGQRNKGKRICAVANFSCPDFLDEPSTNCTRSEFEFDEDKFENHLGCRCCHDDARFSDSEKCANFNCTEVFENNDCKKSDWDRKGELDEGRAFGVNPEKDDEDHDFIPHHKHHQAYCMCCAEDETP